MWIEEQTWEPIRETHDVNTKTRLLFQILRENVASCFPQKVSKHTSDDSPWVNDQVKKLKRLKGREYNKHRKSAKWTKMDEQYKSAIIDAKKKYYKNIVKDLKLSNPSQWYSKLKHICSFDQEKYNPIIWEEIDELTDSEQAKKIAKHFATPRNRYSALQECDIDIPAFDINSIPQFSYEKVKSLLDSLDPKKSVPPGDIPTKILKKFASELAIPVTNVINSSMTQGLWPDIFKTEFITPVPKNFPPKKLNNLRSISGLMTIDKIFEKLLAEKMIEDMSKSLDPSQFGNQKGISIQHYLIQMIHKILSDTDKSEVTAVLATFVDWKDAFPNQCHTLGIQAFINCGVRSSIIPVLMDFFRGRSLIVKWHGTTSEPINVNGGGPQGGYFGI